MLPTKRIQSAGNPRIRKAIRVLAGKDPDRCVVEGKKLLLDAVSSGVKIEEVFLTRGIRIQLPASIPVLELSESLMKKISSLETPPGILAIAGRPKFTVPEIPQKFAAAVVGIRDPGNLGTIMRAAEAAGCEYLLCSKDTVDPLHPRVIRASAGSAFRLPHRKMEDFRLLEELRQKGVTLYGLSGRGKKDLFQFKPNFPSLILIGSEAEGLREDVPVDLTLFIPMSGKVESLNAAMAATLAFYVMRNQPWMPS